MPLTTGEIKAIASRAAETVLEDIKLDQRIDKALCGYADNLNEFFDLFRKKRFAEGNAILNVLIDEDHCSACQEVVGLVVAVASEAEAAAAVSDIAFRKNMAKLYEKVEWAKAAFCPEDDADAGGDEDEVEAEDEAPPPPSAG